MFAYDHDDGIRSNGRRFQVVKVNDDGTQQRVNLKGLPRELPEEVWRPQPHGFTSTPVKDSDGYIVGMGSRSDRMLYVDGGHQKYRPRKVAEGDAAIYNHSGDIVRLFKANLDLVHSQRINIQIGKGQDVSGKDGSKPGENSGPVKSLVFTADSCVITFGNSKITMTADKILHQAPAVTIDSPDVHLGGEGGTLIGLCGGGCATRVKAI